MAHKPLPPFGKELQLALKRGVLPKNDIWLFMGEQAWDYARRFQKYQITLALPLHHDPNHFTWPVDELSILAFDAAALDKKSFNGLQKTDIRKTAYVLLQSGALIVRVIQSNGMLVVYRRDNI